jgi:hypothetical protein
LQNAKDNIWTKAGCSDGRVEKAHNKELCDLYASPSIIRIIKSRRMRWVGHVAQMGQKWNMHRLLIGKPEGETTTKNKM